jgi:hypothetical protein
MLVNPCALSAMKENPKNTKKSIIIVMDAKRNWDLSGIIPNHCGVLRVLYAGLVGI